MITVTGAASRYGILVIEELVSRGVPAADIIAISHDAGPLSSGAQLAALGVQVREADLTTPDALTAVFAGTERLLLIPYAGIETFEPVPADAVFTRNRNALAAANAAGAGWTAYVSGVDASGVNAGIFAAHRQTEDLIRSECRTWTFLRNGLQAERYASLIFVAALDESRIIGIEGDGQVTAAARADLATAAAVVATTDGHSGAVYELTGGAGFTVGDFAGLLTRASGKTIAYDDVPVEEFGKLLTNVLGPELVQPTVDLESAIRAGQLSRRSPDLENLLGRAPATVEQALAAFLQQVSDANR